MTARGMDRPGLRSSATLAAFGFAACLAIGVLVPGNALAADPNALMGGGPQGAEAPATAPAPAEDGSLLERLAGAYKAEGRNADGSRYTGSVTIRIDGERARFRWDIAGQVYTGTGLLAGNVLTVDWGQADPVIYIINDDGTLSGTWDRGRASEKLVPRR